MQIFNIFHVLIAIAMIAFILIQKGAGATAGAAFGSGASGTVFGARGAGNFLSRSTWVLAALFCLISLSMAVMASRMSLTPETDLGVVATAPAVEESAEPTAVNLPLTNEVAESSDLPAFDNATARPAAEDSGGDLPVLEAADQGAEQDPVVTDDGS